ncbi:hypothetical protein C8Q77DRAFT_1160977 [Trametes polyzona]|nr:hypothetical protein C8Q77DRAFT_1160977 [Trametes polyzona]
MRLWPASEEFWCFDFVHSETLEPKNQPSEFELWAVPLAKPKFNQTSWLPLDLVTRRLYSLEHGFGEKAEDIGEGEKKYVFVDGQTPVVMHDDAEVVVF